MPTVRGSIEQLGFKYADVKIVLGSHAHADHMEGDALVKQLTGAAVMAMAEDVPALEKMMPGGKPHPIDKVLHDGDEVKLGGMTLVAHLTPGHTRGCTTWTFREQENGKNYERADHRQRRREPGHEAREQPGRAADRRGVQPRLRDAARSSTRTSRSARIPGMYNMTEKYAKVGKGPNPYIDPAGYAAELDIVEGVFRSVLAQQRAQK